MGGSCRLLVEARQFDGLWFAITLFRNLTLYTAYGS